MAVMAYYMWAMYGVEACHQQLDKPVNGTTLSSSTSNATEADCYEMPMIVNGLSWRNLLLFVFCTPCQVSLEWPSLLPLLCN